ncbi:hypothetical protein D3C71_2092120 [compost metagenome]
MSKRVIQGESEGGQGLAAPGGDREGKQPRLLVRFAAHAGQYLSAQAVDRRIALELRQVPVKGCA